MHELLGGLAEPGPIALRCRLRHLLDAGRPGLAEGALAVDRARWTEVVGLESEADVRLRLGHPHDDAARRAFERLAELEP